MILREKVFDKEVHTSQYPSSSKKSLIYSDCSTDTVRQVAQEGHYSQVQSM